MTGKGCWTFLFKKGFELYSGKMAYKIHKNFEQRRQTDDMQLTREFAQI